MYRNGRDDLTKIPLGTIESLSDGQKRGQIALEKVNMQELRTDREGDHYLDLFYRRPSPSHPGPARDGRPLIEHSVGDGDALKVSNHFVVLIPSLNSIRFRTDPPLPTPSHHPLGTVLQSQTRRMLPVNRTIHFNLPSAYIFELMFSINQISIGHRQKQLMITYCDT